MQKSVESQGVEVRTKVDVERILVSRKKAVGVRLGDGTEITSRVVLSNADPRRTFLKLTGADALNPAFLKQVRNLHAVAGYMKLHCAVKGILDWKVLPGIEPCEHHLAQAAIRSSMDVIDHAWSRTQAGLIPDEFALALVCPSLYDDSLAPQQHHTLTVWAEYAPVRPRDGSWDSLRDVVIRKLVAQIAEYAPQSPQHY